MNRVGVVVFPGTNCEHDVVRPSPGWGPGRTRVARRRDLGPSARSWSRGASPTATTSGPAPRPFSPVMAAVERFAADGGPVVGICNGFQVLTEAGLLPGALQKNRGCGSCAPRWACGWPRPARC